MYSLFVVRSCCYSAVAGTSISLHVEHRVAIISCILTSCQYYITVGTLFFFYEWNEIKNWYATTATIPPPSLEPPPLPPPPPPPPLPSKPPWSCRARRPIIKYYILYRVRLVCECVIAVADEPALAILIRTDNALFIRHTWCTLVLTDCPYIRAYSCILSAHCLCIMRFTLPYNGSNNDYRRGKKIYIFLFLFFIPSSASAERNVSVFSSKKKKTV